MDTKPLKCIYEFSKDAPRDKCELPAGSDNLCIFHSDQSSSDFIAALEHEVSNPDHWLEGIKIKQDLIGVKLKDANMLKADFDGRRLINVVFTGALLKEANFRSTHIENTIFNNSDLSNACFNFATLQGVKGHPVDFRNSELGGASFRNSNLKSLRLLGAKFSTKTHLETILYTPCFEMETGSWDDAATVYANLGKRASEDWDFDAINKCLYLSFTCKHRKIIKTDPLSKKHKLLNLVIDSFLAGPVGWFWLAHRIIWGYGLRPFRILFVMFIAIVFFSLIFFYITGVEQDNSSFVDTLSLSLTTFVTLGSYNNQAPSGKLGEFIGGVEALSGIILLDLFLIALVSKYVKRF